MQGNVRWAAETQIFQNRGVKRRGCRDSPFVLVNGDDPTDFFSGLGPSPCFSFLRKQRALSRSVVIRYDVSESLLRHLQPTRQAAETQIFLSPSGDHFFIE